MKTTVLRNRPQWLIIGTVVLAATVGGALRIFSGAETTKTPAVVESAEPTESTEPTAELFQSPMVRISTELRKAATPSELVNSTASEDRLSVIAAGRVDPFAPITRTIGATSSPRKPEEATANNGASTSPNIAALPTAPVANTPNLPPVPTISVAPQPPTLPAIPAAPNPVSIPALPNSVAPATPVPLNPVDAIELTGVVQVGDRVGVIVREGQGQTSRHLFEGDLLAGGQIRVKSIDLSAQEPLVILEYQGKEYPRMVG
jgi:hypothetical protein